MRGDFSSILLRGIENLLIAGFVGMIALVFGNVVMRYIFNSGIIMAEEVARFIFVWLTFGGAFLVSREGGHLGMTSVVAKLSPGAQKACRAAAEMMSLVCVLLVIIGSWRQILINIDNRAPITGIPLAVSYMAALNGGLGMAGLSAWNLYRLATGRMRPEEYVVGTESEEFAAGHAPRGEPPR